MKTKFIGAAMALGLSVLGVSESANALTITRNFTGGAAHASAVGGGTLQNIFNYAADWWEGAIQDAHAVSISYSWAALGGSTLGVHNLVSQSGAPNRETAGNIRFDNDGTSVFFMDGTPGDNSEFSTLTTSSADLGGGMVNTGRVYTGAMGLAAGRIDMLSIALHEIGHALGLSSANTAFQAENVDLDIDVIGGLFGGSVIPTISGAHINIGSTLMFPTFGSGQRRLIAGTDVLANCQISQFANCNLNPSVTVSEPGTLAVLGLGLAGLGFARRKRAA